MNYGPANSEAKNDFLVRVLFLFVIDRIGTHNKSFPPTLCQGTVMLGAIINLAYTMKEELYLKERILNLHHDGLKQQNITDTVRVPEGYVILRNQHHFSACYMSESTDLHRNYHRHLPSSFQERKFPIIKVKI